MVTVSVVYRQPTGGLIAWTGWTLAML